MGIPAISEFDICPNWDSKHQTYPILEPFDVHSVQKSRIFKSSLKRSQSPRIDNWSWERSTDTNTYTWTSATWRKTCTRRPSGSRRQVAAAEPREHSATEQTTYFTSEKSKKWFIMMEWNWDRTQKYFKNQTTSIKATLLQHMHFCQ